MEHLRDLPLVQEIQIPCHCQEMYDCQSFDTYHIRKNRDLVALSRADFGEGSEEDAIGFLQAWMYFGLLWEFFGSFEGFQLANFVAQNDARTQLVTTEWLPYWINRWRVFIQEMTPQQRSAHFEKTRIRLLITNQLASLFCKGASSHESRQQSTWYLTLDISLSIQVLADTLQHAGHELFKGAYNIDWGSSPLLETIMRQNGWCPRAIATCKYGQQIHNLYFASTLRPHGTIKAHERCDERLCAWEQIDEETYETQHRSDCSGSCPFLGLDVEGLSSLYDRGMTPLIYLSNATGAEVVEITGSDSNTPYIAISHVWADGLGNSRSNALPVCQLRFLQRLVERFHGGEEVDEPLYWWCDTICVPVDPTLKHHRKTAIVKMSETYKNAIAVLVLDSELLNTSVDATPVELYIRLKLSSWARRLWTLQEAVLSTTAVVQFAGGQRTLPQLHDALKEYSQHEDRHLYTRYQFLARTFFAPFLQLRTDSFPSTNFTSAWKQIQWRATSHQSDEPVCLAGITGLDPNPILAVSTDYSKRMAEYLKLLQHIPYILLIQPAPRLSEPGFRWAPASLLNCFRVSRTNPFRVIAGVAQIEREGKGLEITASGTELIPDVTRPFSWNGEPFHVFVTLRDIETESYRVDFLFQEDQQLLREAQHGRKVKPVIVFIAKDPMGWLAILGEMLGDVTDGQRISLIFVAVVTLIKRQGDNELPSRTLEDRLWLVT